MTFNQIFTQRKSDLNWSKNPQIKGAWW